VLLDHEQLSGRARRAAARERLGSALVAATRRNEVDVVVLNYAPPLPRADAADSPGGSARMTFLIDRLAEIRRHLEHLESLRTKVRGTVDLRRDLSLHNDVMFSLLAISQLVIDVCGELSARAGLRFESYAEAVRNLTALGDFPDDLVEQLARLPGFRDILIHEYVAFDYQRAVAVLNELQPVARFVALVAAREARGVGDDT